MPRATADDAGPHDPSPVDDVALIATRFAQAIGADGWALTSVHQHGATRCIAADARGDALVAGLLPIADQIEARLGHQVPAPIWCDVAHAAEVATALVIPVDATRGPESLFVNLLFDAPDDHRRRSIESVCLREWPGVAAYLRLWQAMRSSQRRIDGIEAGLNLVAIGIVVLSGDGHIVFANDTARHLMQRHDGIREHRGQVQATDRGDAAALSTAIGYVLSQSGGPETGERMPLLMLRREQGPPLVTSFVCAPRPDEGALLFFVDPGLDIHLLAEPVCKLFRLSRVETELACLLASGQTLAAAAQSLHVKLGTARGYLKQVFVKTGSNRQVDLVRLIFSNLVRTSTNDHPRRRS